MRVPLTFEVIMHRDVTSTFIAHALLTNVSSVIFRSHVLNRCYISLKVVHLSGVHRRKATRLCI